MSSHMDTSYGAIAECIICGNPTMGLGTRYCGGDRGCTIGPNPREHNTVDLKRLAKQRVAMSFSIPRGANA